MNKRKELREEFYHYHSFWKHLFSDPSKLHFFVCCNFFLNYNFNFGSNHLK